MFNIVLYIILPPCSSLFLFPILDFFETTLFQGWRQMFIHSWKLIMEIPCLLLPRSNLVADNHSERAAFSWISQTSGHSSHSRVNELRSYYCWRAILYFCFNHNTPKSLQFRYKLFQPKKPRCLLAVIAESESTT